MVRSYTIEEPNLSYVRLNLNSRAGKVNRENETSTGEEDTKKVYITQNLSASNKKVINAELLNKALTQQNLPPPPPTTALWRPRHLYNDEENDEIWSDVTEKTNNSTAKKKSRKRPCKYEIQPVKKLRKSPGNGNTKNINETGCFHTTEINSLRQQNTSLKKKIEELAQKIELYGSILKSPSKLLSLHEFLLKKQIKITPKKG